jgi:hypothetical protein
VIEPCSNRVATIGLLHGVAHKSTAVTVSSWSRICWRSRSSFTFACWSGRVRRGERSLGVRLRSFFMASFLMAHFPVATWWLSSRHPLWRSPWLLGRWQVPHPVGQIRPHASKQRSFVPRVLPCAYTGAPAVARRLRQEGTRVSGKS